MIVKRTKNEILVRIPIGDNFAKIQSILEYLRYEELTSKSTATQENVDTLVQESKKDDRIGLKRN